MAISPPRAITDEPLFRARFVEYILPRLCRALRAGFEQLQPQLQALQLTPVGFDIVLCKTGLPTQHSLFVSQALILNTLVHT